MQPRERSVHAFLTAPFACHFGEELIGRKIFWLFRCELSNNAYRLAHYFQMDVPLGYGVKLNEGFGFTVDYIGYQKSTET